MGVQEEVKLIVPEGSASDYLTADVWKGFKMIVDEKGDFGKHVITISKAGQLAYFCDRNLDFSNVEGLKAYIATGYDKTTGTIWLTRVKDVPAKTGIYLVGSEKNYEVPIVPETKSYYVNYLLGSIDPVTINETNEYTYINYYLSNGSNGVGFYRVNGTQDLPAYRSYLQIPYNIKNTGSAGETERIEISAGQLAYSSEKSLDFTDLPQVRAYTATGYEKGSGTIWLTRVKKVPAGTGILIMADNDTYEVPTASMQCCYQDMFVSVVNGATIYPTESNYYTNYYLSNGTAGVGFYKVTKEEGVELKANRCYLQVPTWMTPSATAGTRGAGLSGISFQEEDDVISIPLFRGIEEDKGGTTNLTPALSEGEGAWYTLQGQRVSKPGKGLYIHNGKKIVIK